MQGDFGAPGSDRSLDPVLNQRHRLDGVTVQLVRFAPDHPALVIFGADKSESHILGVLGVVNFLGAQSHLDHYEMAQDLGEPHVVGSTDAEQLEVPNYWYPWLNGGTPTTFTATVGLAEGDLVTELADSRPWLGAWVGVGAGPGVTVSDVIAGTPAAAVLAPGDRIVSVNGNTPAQGLGPDLLALSPGDQVTLTVDRGGEFSDVRLRLSDWPKAPSFVDSPESATIGVKAAPLSGRRGLAVTEVAVGSAAERAGLATTDAIVSIGDFTTADPADLDPADLDAALSGRAGTALMFTVEHGDGTTGTLTITPDRGDELDSLVAPL